jgi:integrase
VRPDPPERPKSTRTKAIDGADLNRLLSAADEPRIECLLAVMGTLGLRTGEALGLAWDMVDLESEILSVERNLVPLKSGVDLGTPKTQDHSVRSLPLPPQLVASLRRWRSVQASERLAAPTWDRSFGVDFVFTDEAGRPLSRGRLATAVKRCAAEAGVGRISPHSLRHSAGSIALGAGVPITEVSRMLGHKNPGITLQVYAHDLTDGTRAATAIAEAVGSWVVSGGE